MISFGILPPNWQEADNADEHTRRSLTYGFEKIFVILFSTDQHQMAESTSEKKHTLDGQGDEKYVEVAVIPEPDAVADPGTVVVEPKNSRGHQSLWGPRRREGRAFSPVHAVVADGAVRRPRGPEDFTREAVLELHGLIFDHNFFGSRRRPVGRSVAHDRLDFDLALNVRGLGPIKPEIVSPF